MKKESVLNRLEQIRLLVEIDGNDDRLGYLAVIDTLVEYLNDKDIREKVDSISL